MLDETTIALAATVGKALVQAMVTDGWGAVRDQFARVLGRGNDDRRVRTAQQLDETATLLRSGRLEQAGATGRWQGRIESWLEDNPDGADELSALLAKIQKGQRRTPVPNQQATASGNSTINQVHGGRDAAGRDINKSTHLGGIMVVLAVVATLLIVGSWGIPKVITLVTDAIQSSTITKDTLCRDYLQASTQDRDHAVKSIGLEVGATGTGNPMAILNVDYACGQQPDTPVGNIIAKQNY